jgi:phosphate-selective porin OprO/OprP
MRTAGTPLGARLVPIVLAAALAAGAGARAQAQAPPPPDPSPPAPAALPDALPPSNEALLQELRQLRQEVQEAQQLREQLRQLQAEVGAMRAQPPAPHLGNIMDGAPPTPAAALPGSVGLGVGVSSGTGPGGPGASSSGPGGGPPGGGSGSGGSASERRSIGPGTFGGLSLLGNDTQFNFLPLQVRYRYQSTAEGPIAGGTYLELSDFDEEFVFKFQNQVMIDSTNYDRQGMNTTEQGFNIPFGRTGFWGNVTKNYFYQVCLQYFLGEINLLDMFAGYQWDKYRIRLGKGLSPVLYEYYAFDPGFEPVMTNSMSYQLANKRPIGATFIVNDTYYQAWAGVTNNLVSGYYDLGRNAQFVSALTLTPFKKREDSIFRHLGAGVGTSAGWESYSLNDPDGLGPNHIEQTTNNAWFTSTGVPFAVYNTNVSSVGERMRVAPHLFWYGRASFVGEYILHSRELSDGTTIGRSTQRAWQATASYYLTGERDYGGNGIQGFSSVEPIRPFIPTKGLWGIGAWQVAAQYSAFDAGRGDFDRGFIDASKWTNRAEQIMGGVNWWPVKNTRLSAQVLWNGFNNPITVSENGGPVDSFTAFWFRYATFF